MLQNQVIWKRLVVGSEICILKSVWAFENVEWLIFSTIIRWKNTKIPCVSPSNKISIQFFLYFSSQFEKELSGVNFNIVLEDLEIVGSSALHYKRYGILFNVVFHSCCSLFDLAHLFSLIFIFAFSFAFLSFSFSLTLC